MRIRAEYGTPEFDTAYVVAAEGLAATKPRKASTGSLAWLWDRYREVGAWTALAPATRRQRENIMVGILKANASAPCSTVTGKDSVAGRDRRAHTPYQARNFLDTMRGLFRWAYEAAHICQEPTLGVKNPPNVKGPGFLVWSEDEVDRYHARWPVGTKERVWIDVLLYTGLRRGDAVTIGRQHVRGGVASIRTEKSGGEVTVTIPILPVLDATLRAGPCGELAFICGANRTPLTKHVPRRCQCRRRQEVSPRLAQGWRYTGGRERGDHCRTGGAVQLGGRWNGIASHPRCGSGEACARRDFPA